ncbi:hypothetical protein ACTWPT_46500 [Nonomuraea sp. 3N208]|uniref:hypothetical protein n=1 Tax=Nonomuraea sp. 3N208 TaxID=3457421 RepID=UPI003FD4F1F5
MKRVTRAPATPPQQRKFSWPVSIAIVAGLFITAAALPYLVHPLLYPWAVSLTGEPTLPGYWHGQASFPGQGQRRVVMDLRAEPRRGRCSNCSPIDGELKVCGTGRRIVYEIWGDVSDRSASRFSLYARPGNRALATSSGMSLTQIKGQWPGGDTITITASDSRRPSDQPVRFQMRRTTEAAFTTAC